MANGPETLLVMLDVVVLSPEKGDALLIRREGSCGGLWALPGSVVEVEEKLEDTAAQIAKDEAGLDVQDMRLVGVYSDPDHDLRGHDASCTFLAAGWSGEPSLGSDAAEIAFVYPSEGKIRFDHEKIISDASAIIA